MTELPSSQVGDLHVATVVINVGDMERAVSFWSEALGYEPREEDWNAEFMMLVDPLDLHLPVSLQHSDDRPLQPARVPTRQRDLHVERLLALGAERVEDWPYPSDADFIVLRDPDGNEFCASPTASWPRAPRADCRREIGTGSLGYGVRTCHRVEGKQCLNTTPLSDRYMILVLLRGSVDR